MEITTFALLDTSMAFAVLKILAILPMGCGYTTRSTIMTDRLQANMEAAKMLGYVDAKIVYGRVAHSFWKKKGFSSPKNPSGLQNMYTTFDIFTNPSDFLDAVNKLLWHGCSIEPCVENGELLCVRIIADCDNGFTVEGKDLQDATGATCIEVMKS